MTPRDCVRCGLEAQAIVERATDLIETTPDEAAQWALIRYILEMLTFFAVLMPENGP